jgi:hypothetical protein
MRSTDRTVVIKSFAVHSIDGSSTVNTVEAEIYYSLGGMNYFTYKNDPRGYYFSLTPFTDNGISRSYTAFSGVKTCILPVCRKSQKKAAEAKTQFEGLIDKYLDAFLAKNGLALGEAPKGEAPKDDKDDDEDWIPFC